MTTPLVAADTPAVSPAGPGVGREILAWLRLALFLPVHPLDLVGRGYTIALLAGLWLVTWIAVDPLVHAAELAWSWRVVPGLVYVAVGVFALAWLLDRLSRPRPGLRRTGLLAVGALPLAMVGEVASWKLIDAYLQPLMAALSLYAVFYLARGLRLFTRRWQPAALFGAALFVAALLASFTPLQVQTRAWVRADALPEAASRAAVDGLALTRAQFEQPARIEAQVAALAPPSAASEIYFLGFAGYGQQQVFAREIDLAARVVGERFAARERTVRLVNDQRDLGQWPLATIPGLRHALRRLGAVMDDDDVLFLTLSSHGERDAGLRVISPGLVGTELEPRQLAALLRESGIGWRVVVVSACYSGSFVDALADERTIVIAAAAADRKSFGCNDRRQLTYFGEAFFQDALPGAGSLRQAFETARTALEAKERAAGIVPSRPRARFGAQLEARLDAMAAALARASGARPVIREPGAAALRAPEPAPQGR